MLRKCQLGCAVAVVIGALIGAVNAQEPSANGAGALVMEAADGKVYVAAFPLPESSCEPYYQFLSGWQGTRALPDGKYDSTSRIAVRRTRVVRRMPGREVSHEFRVDGQVVVRRTIDQESWEVVENDGTSHTAKLAGLKFGKYCNELGTAPELSIVDGHLLPYHFMGEKNRVPPGSSVALKLTDLSWANATAVSALHYFDTIAQAHEAMPAIANAGAKQRALEAKLAADGAKAKVDAEAAANAQTAQENAERTRTAALQLKREEAWRKKLREGDETNCGPTLELKKGLVKVYFPVQNYGNEHWIRVELLKPPGAGCRFVNGQYVGT